MAKAQVSGKGLEPWLEAIRKLATKRVVIGLLGSGKAHEQHGPSATNVDVGTWMEFGTVDRFGNEVVPARSFLRSTMRTKAPEIRKFVENRIGRVMKGKATAEEAYTAIGVKVVALVQGTIRAGIGPPLKHRVGVPLIDKSQLLKAQTAEVRSK